MEESRKQFQKWWEEFYETQPREPWSEIYSPEHDYFVDQDIDGQYDAWKASRAAITSAPVVAYQDHYGNAVSAGDFDGGEDEMHETAHQEGWHPLILSAGLKIKGE